MILISLWIQFKESPRDFTSPSKKFLHNLLSEITALMCLSLQIKEYYCKRNDGDWITAILIRGMVWGVCVHSFILKRGRHFFFYFWSPSTSDHIIHTIQYKSKHISISSEASLQQKHNTHKDYQLRQRDSWWFSNRVYSSFPSLVKQWQIHLISAVWCYMNFTRETLSSSVQMSLKPEPSHSLFYLIEALRGKLNNSPV